MMTGFQKKKKNLKIKKIQSNEIQSPKVANIV
jgi:hypothetical protein